MNKQFKSTESHLDELSRSLFGKTYKQLTRKERDKVFIEFKNQRSINGIINK